MAGQVDRARAVFERAAALRQRRRPARRGGRPAHRRAARQLPPGLQPHRTGQRRLGHRRGGAAGRRHRGPGRRLDGASATRGREGRRNASGRSKMTDPARESRLARVLGLPGPDGRAGLKPGRANGNHGGTDRILGSLGASGALKVVCAPSVHDATADCADARRDGVPGTRSHDAAPCRSGRAEPDAGRHLPRPRWSGPRGRRGRQRRRGAHLRRVRRGRRRARRRAAPSGVGRGDRVGVRIPSGTIDLYVAILGILVVGRGLRPGRRRRPRRAGPHWCSTRPTSPPSSATTW